MAFHVRYGKAARIASREALGHSIFRRFNSSALHRLSRFPLARARVMCSTCTWPVFQHILASISRSLRLISTRSMRIRINQTSAKTALKFVCIEQPGLLSCKKFSSDPKENLVRKYIYLKTDGLKSGYVRVRYWCMPVSNSHRLKYGHRKSLEDFSQE